MTASDLHLLTAYEPVVRFTEGELFFRASVEEYVAQSEPRQRSSVGHAGAASPVASAFVTVVDVHMVSGWRLEKR